jgi:hypothetical protein
MPMSSAWSKVKQIDLGGRDLQPWLIAVLPPAPFGLAAARSSHSYRQIVNPRRLTILFWLYIAQALAGSVVGFAAPFLYYFGVL